MITSGMFDPGTGAPMGEPMTPYSTESVWEPGPVESEDPHDDPYGGDLDLGPVPPNIARNDDDDCDGDDGYGDDDDEDCARSLHTARSSVPGPMSRSRQGG